MSKQGFIKGSIILISSVIIAKAIGAVFKIPVTNMLGGEGMSFFSGAYGLFLPVYAVTANGLTTAAAKLTAEYSAVNDTQGLLRVHRTALVIFSLLGGVGSILLVMFARPFADKVVMSPDSYLALIAIAPCVLLGCVTAVYRGCREGQSNMYPTAISQVIEAVVRLAAGLGLCSFVLKYPEKVLPYLPSGTSVTAAAAAAAVLGITLSMTAGTAFLYITGTGCDKLPDVSLKKVKADKKTAREIMKIFIPVALGAAAANLTSLIDLGTLIRGIKKGAETAPQYFFDTFGLDSTVNIPEFIYGSFTGLAVTIFNLVPSITNMFGKSILPHISGCCACGELSRVKHLTEKMLWVTSFIAVPCGAGLTVLSKEVLLLLFGSRPTECAVSAQSLSILGIAVVFTCLTASVFSCYQAAGRADVPVKLMLIGAAVKLMGNLLLIPIPQLNVSGAAISTLACYFVIFVLSVLLYPKTLGVRISLSGLLPVGFSGVLCGGAAWVVYPLLPFSRVISIGLAAVVGGGVYFTAVYLSSNGKP